MRLVFALIAALSAGSAFAQDNPGQRTRPMLTEPQTTGQGSGGGVPSAPVGHFQPRPADLPAEIRDSGAQRTPDQVEFDKKLRICRGC